MFHYCMTAFNCDDRHFYSNAFSFFAEKLVFMQIFVCHTNKDLHKYQFFCNSKLVSTLCTLCIFSML